MPKSRSWWKDTTAVEQRSDRAEAADSEMFIADAADEDCDPGVSAITNPHMQRGGEYSEMVLGGDAPFMEKRLDNVASTLEWREKVLQSQQAAAQAIASSSRQRQTAEERWHAKLETEIEQIRQRFREEEEMLEREIVNLEERYELDMRQLEEEENDDENYYVDEQWEVQSDYQPTECGDDGSGSTKVDQREMKRACKGTVFLSSNNCTALTHEI
jgi:hypothetical protein